MNFMAIIGLTISGIILFTGLKLASPDLTLFFDGPSLFIVIGGTFAASSVAFQLNKLGILFKVFITQFIKGKNHQITTIIKNIMQICEGVRNGETLESLSSKAKDPFLKESIELISDGILEREKVMVILHKRSQQMNYLRTDDAKKVKALGKYPPAFGMMGTTIGMIVLLANLGGADAMKMIVIIANLIVIPISENIEALTKGLDLQNKIILEGIGHIIDKSNPVLVAEDLNSYLLPKDRLDWKSASA